MATNKNQHFVPRCHLRPFTKEEEGRCINVFNIDRDAFIQNAPVKNQCSRDYFYGKSKILEDAIQYVEGHYSSVIADLRKPNVGVQAGHKAVLRRFWLLQHLRTEAASRRSVEMAAIVSEFVGKDASDFRLKIREAVQIAMKTYSETMSIIDDLKVCIIRNRTASPFVTSDDPAVLTNRWHFEDRRILGRSFGIQSAGAIGLLPLTPYLACLLYDGDVYSVQHNEGWIDARKQEDVRSINQHQFLNCLANIYTHDLSHSEDLISQSRVASMNRIENRHTVHVALLDKTEGEFSRYKVVDATEYKSVRETQEQGEALLHSKIVHPRPTSWPSIIQWRIPGRVFTNGTGLGYVRRQIAETRTSSRKFWREKAR